MAREYVKGIKEVQGYVNKRGREVNNEFRSELINELRKVSRELQTGITQAAEGGVVPFTDNSMLTFFSKRPTGVTVTLMVKDIQAQYLYGSLVEQKNIDKFIPTSNAKLTKQGNITGLKSNLKSGKYKVVEQKGTKRIIDTRKKDDRVIAVKKPKTRKIIYDWYGNADKKINIVINGLRGEFSTRNK
ncbi:MULTISPECIES: hypothetical protein [Citrobacter]|uniref:hypothetical protein n=1 Tax=Citrobacter TaxID=544 RepID=UPI001902A04A|nr:hypothetical protein [Citrobacter sp. FDAARGOS_156]MBJ8884407.1 hypothetical protein [Citrobacter sp. FDAARGOS_156]HED2478348.1 hypothetical protein [Citrobacter youngae]